MTIEFVANTIADFLADAAGSGLADSGSNDHLDVNYVNNAIEFQVFPGASTPFTIELGAEHTDCWFHLRYQTARNFVGGSDGRVIGFRDGTNALVAALDCNNDGHRAEASGDSTVLGVTREWPSDTNITLDIHIQVGANIQVDVYWYGSLISTATAANTGAKGGVQTIIIENSDVTDSSTRTVYVSELIVTSGGESTLGWRLSDMVPNGAGFHTDWDGDFNELADQDVAIAAGTSTAGDRLSSTVNYAGPSDTDSIRAVIAKCVLTRGDTGPANHRQFVRIGGTDYDGASEAVAIGNQNFTYEWATNPDTLVAWVPADFTGIEVGILAEA